MLPPPPMTIPPPPPGWYPGAPAPRRQRRVVADRGRDRPAGRGADRRRDPVPAQRRPRSRRRIVTVAEAGVAHEPRPRWHLLGGRASDLRPFACGGLPCRRRSRRVRVRQQRARTRRAGARRLGAPVDQTASARQVVAEEIIVMGSPASATPMVDAITSTARECVTASVRPSRADGAESHSSIAPTGAPDIGDRAAAFHGSMGVAGGPARGRGRHRGRATRTSRRCCCWPSTRPAASRRTPVTSWPTRS